MPFIAGIGECPELCSEGAGRDCEVDEPNDGDEVAIIVVVAAPVPGGRRDSRVVRI
jgi:hypothetical protein